MQDYSIGEEVEVLLTFDGREKKMKAVINDYDSEKNEFGCLIRYGIKPENVRKLRKDKKVRLIKHEDYYPTQARFYVDKELGIDIPCQLLSMDEYDNGKKEYKIEYQDEDKNCEIKKIVNENKIVMAFLPSYEDNDMKKYENEIIKENNRIQEISISRNEYEAQ